MSTFELKLDPGSPEAHRAAELARELTTARMSVEELVNDDFEAAVTELLTGTVEEAIEKVAYILCAFTKITGVILDSNADDHAKAGQPKTAQDLWAYYAEQIAARGWTI